MKKIKGRDLVTIWVERETRQKIKERADREHKSVIELLEQYASKTSPPLPN